MGYDSYYKREGSEEIKKDEEKTDESEPVSIAGPLFFWVGLLAVGAVLQLVAIPFAISYNHTAFDGYFNSFANYVIYIPGLVVLPLISSLWIGDRVSYATKKKTEMAYKGLVNGLYASLVYVVAIFIIYFVMTFRDTGVLSSLTVVTFAEYLIALPVAITLIMVPLFAILSAARRYG